MPFTTVEPDHIFNIPREVAICPYCEAEIFASFDRWEMIDDGSWVGRGVHFDCASEPENTDSAKWRVYVNEHTYMPYVYRLPVAIKIERWVAENYRFDMSTERA